MRSIGRRERLSSPPSTDSKARLGEHAGEQPQGRPGVLAVEVALGCKSLSRPSPSSSTPEFDPWLSLESHVKP